MILNGILASLALLSLALLIWQWIAAIRFPLHQRIHRSTANAPAITVLKPLKGRDDATEDCLRSWLAQDYAGDMQFLFGVASENDPACTVVKQLIEEFPGSDARLVITGNPIGTNAKVSQLAVLENLARHDVIVVSDADVRVPADYLRHAIQLLEAKPGAGLVNSFYRLANPVTSAMQWEAIAINADFWSQVLQSKSLKPIDFALGAVMITRRIHLKEIGGFESLANCLADDYQLGNRLARRGHSIALSEIVVECWDPPMGWKAVWNHQLRWARTIRVCQPIPYFFSILSNAGLWALLWLMWSGWCVMQQVQTQVWDSGMMTEVTIPPAFLAALGCLVIRIFVAVDLQRRLVTSMDHAACFWLVPIKDLLQAAIWVGAFAGNSIEWRGDRYRLERDGTIVSADRTGRRPH